LLEFLRDFFLQILSKFSRKFILQYSAMCVPVLQQLWQR